MSQVAPLIKVITHDQMDEIHKYSLKILSTVGVRVDSDEARRIFAESGGASVKKDKVYIFPELIDHAIKQAPSTVDMYDRKGSLAFTIGDAKTNRTRFGIGVTNLYYQDPWTDAVEPFARGHVTAAARLGERLESFDLVSTPGVLQDLPPETADLYATLDLVANTCKPLVLLISKSDLFAHVLDLIESLHGPLSPKPFIIPYFNPITPLILNAETTEMMKICLDRGVPFIFSNYGMSGTSAPITPAGTLAVLNAELLAGLVFAQLVQPGAPLILGSLPAAFDMRRMTSVYTPMSMLLNLVCAEMMAYYDLPHAGTSGSGTGWGPDLLASGTFWMNHLTSCLGKVGIAPFVGGNFESLAFSPATIVYADSIIRQVREFVDGFEINEDSVGFEEIASIGPAGSYLAAPLTLRHCRKADYGSAVWPVLTLEQWELEGQPKAVALLRKYTVDLIADLQAPEDHEQLLERGEAFIRNL